MRQVFAEGDARAAWRLVETIQMGSEDLRNLHRDILEGKKKLVGDSSSAVGLQVEDDEDEAHMRASRAVYAGRVRHAGGWWVPRAVVTAFGEEDARFAFAKWRGPHLDDLQDPEGSISELGENIFDFVRLRVAFYAREGEQVFLVGHAPRQRAVLFAATTEIPLWWTAPKSLEEALQQWLDVGHVLEERGASRVSEAKAHASRRLRALPRPDEVFESESDLAKNKEGEAMRQRIIAQAAGDLFTLSLDDGTEVSVPRAPFVRWVLDSVGRQMGISLPKIPWKNVAPSGLKLTMDNPNHSDWILGAGFPLLTARFYGTPLERAGDAERWRMLQEARITCAVLVPPTRNEAIVGTVGEDIAVVPSLDVQHTDAVFGARAVLTERGGALAHLAVVATERSIPVFRMADAVANYPPGTVVRLEPDPAAVIVLRRAPGLPDP